MNKQLIKSYRDGILNKFHNIKFRERQFAILVLLLLFGLYTVALTNNLFPGGDNARYLILAKSLLTGRGYRNIGSLTPTYHTLATPGFPLLLALIMLVFGSNFVVIKIFMSFLALLMFLVVYTLFKRKYDRSYAMKIAVIYAIMPVVFMYTRRIYSDIPFVLTSSLASIYIEYYGKQQSHIIKNLSLSALLLVISFYFRPVALTLLLATIFWLLTKKMWKRASLLLLLVIIFILPWYYWVSRVNTTSVGHFSAFLPDESILYFIKRSVLNFMEYSRLFTENILYFTTKGFEHLGFSESFSLLSKSTIILMTIFILIGFLDCLRKGIEITEVYTIVYTGVLLAYSFVIDRFIIPILPFIIHYCIRGVIIFDNKAIQRVKLYKRFLVKTESLFVIFVILSSFTHIVARLYQEQHFSTFFPAYSNYYDIARWANKHLKSTAGVITDFPDFFYIYGGQRAIKFTKDNLHYLNNPTVEFIVMDNTQKEILSQQLQKEEIFFYPAPLYCSGSTSVCLYKIHR
ncbi:MAG: glycosyltransferase family 39 protein [Anaerolineae bacterium]|nr:glycosyltransferase family 39 protein [Anaerolineae bacterium]